MFWWLPKAKVRLAIYVILLIASYSTASFFKASSGVMSGHIRLNQIIYADSLDATTFQSVDASEVDSIEGVILARHLIQVIETPLYFHELYHLQFIATHRVEIGKRIEVRVGTNYTEAANAVDIEFSKLETPNYLRSSVLASVPAEDITPAMRSIFIDRGWLTGSTPSEMRFTLVLIANIIWLLAWIAILIECILGYIRRHKHDYKRRNDLCFACSYQLSRDMSQCPECGKLINWRAYALKPSSQVSSHAQTERSQPSPQTHQ